MPPAISEHSHYQRSQPIRLQLSELRRRRISRQAKICDPEA